MRKSSTLFLVIIVIMSAVVLFVFNPAETGPAYSPRSVSDNGTRLLYDTLSHMGYPVRISYRPLTNQTNTNYVYIIIQPFSPSINRHRAEEILEWVQEGGRLIFLHNSQPNIFDIMIPSGGRGVGGLTVYEVGYGEIVTGQAFGIANYNLMNNPAQGRVIESTLSRWDADRIWFAAYYHGFHTEETFFEGLPLIIQLVLVQAVLTAITVVWHFGKRYGNIVPYYEEVERGENEHVFALARLYYKFRRR